VFFGLPILAIIGLLTLVGIPPGLGLLAALGLIYTLGYGATAWIVGRRILREPTAWVLALLVRRGILRELALIPIPLSAHSQREDVARADLHPRMSEPTSLVRSVLPRGARVPWTSSARSDLLLWQDRAWLAPAGRSGRV